MTVFARLLMLVALWLLAWGEVSLVNVISGIAVAPSSFHPSGVAGGAS